MKIFYKKFSEISGGRFDAVSHSHSFLFADSKYELKKLKEICNINPSVDMNKFITQDKNVSFIPMELLSNDGKSFSTLSQKAFLCKGFTKFQNNDLLWAKITPCMQNKKSAVVNGLENGVGFGSTEFFVIRAKNSNIANIHFILQILRMDLVIEQAKLNFKGSAGQQRVSKDFLENLKSPLPPKEIQQHIIDIMDNAYLEKRRKESEAQAILDSIDDFLLSELGISLPPKATNDLQSRIFFVNLSEISGTRFDPEYHQHYYTALQNAIHQGKYAVANLGSVVSFLASGSTPQAKGSDYEENGKYYFLRLTNFNENLEINLDNALFVKEHIYKQELARVQVRKRDILFGIAGSIGKVAMFNFDKFAVINQAMAILRFKENISLDFMLYLLHSPIVQMQVERLKRPVAQPNINTQELKSLLIPLPPLSVQESIAKEISRRKNNALSLQQEAKSILESAKSNIEQIILG